jgi:hypothetical protein
MAKVEEVQLDFIKKKAAEFIKEAKLKSPQADSNPEDVMTLVEVAQRLVIDRPGGGTAEEFLELAKALENAKTEDERDALMLKYLAQGVN